MGERTLELSRSNALAEREPKPYTSVSTHLLVRVLNCPCRLGCLAVAWRHTNTRIDPSQLHLPGGQP